MTVPNPNKKGIKLSVDDTKLQGELNNFKSQIESKFSIKNSDRIDQNRWEKQRNQFINHMKNYSSELIIYLANYRDYCINEVNYGGCMADYDKTTNILTASYDFSKTDTQICSVVLFVGEINALTKYEKNKNLQFSLQANSEFQITVEMKLIHQDVQYKINATQEWADYSIPLQEFRGAKDNWKKLTEIKFLAYRKDINKGTIRIKDLRII